MCAFFMLNHLTIICVKVKCTQIFIFPLTITKEEEKKREDETEKNVETNVKLCKLVGREKVKKEDCRVHLTGFCFLGRVNFIVRFHI
jgi:hypothetical protein